jgi:hypothetical protein
MPGRLPADRLWGALRSVSSAKGTEQSPLNALSYSDAPARTPVYHDSTGNTFRRLVVRTVLVARHDELHLILQAQLQLLQNRFLNDIFRI